MSTSVERRERRDRGFTLPELLIAIVITSTIVSVLVMTIVTSMRTAPSVSNPKAPYPTAEGDRLKPESPAAIATDWEKPYPQYQPAGKALLQLPPLGPGQIPPIETPPLRKFWTAAIRWMIEARLPSGLTPAAVVNCSMASAILIGNWPTLVAFWPIRAYAVRMRAGCAFASTLMRS